MKDAYDVVVIGAATAGSYFGKLMAEQGMKVLIVDRLSSETLGRRLDIFHLDKEVLPVFGVPEPRPGEGALCVGDPVVLCQGARGGKLEAWSMTGRRLGSLPPAESEALSGLLADGSGRLRGHTWLSRLVQPVFGI